jgi:hypothetical protein
VRDRRRGAARASRWVLAGGATTRGRGVKPGLGRVVSIFFADINQLAA